MVRTSVFFLWLLSPSLHVIITFVLLLFSSPPPSDEQQALQQFPEGHPAGQQAAERLQSQRRGGLRAAPAAHQARCLWDTAPRGWSQVVLWQLHLLPASLANPGYHDCWGKYVELQGLDGFCLIPPFTTCSFKNCKNSSYLVLGNYIKLCFQVTHYNWHKYFIVIKKMKETVLLSYDKCDNRPLSGIDLKWFDPSTPLDFWHFPHDFFHQWFYITPKQPNLYSAPTSLA